MKHYLAISLISLFTLLSASAMGAEKSFNGVTCKTDIPAALIGRHMPNELIATTEANHKVIGLKGLGSFGMENGGDPWTLISWEICGMEYLLLERRGVVRDVLASPLPKGNPQSQIVSCVADGLSLKGTAVAFVSSKDMQWPKLVEHAWQINDKAIRFSKIEAKEIVCTP